MMFKLKETVRWVKGEKGKSKCGWRKWKEMITNLDQGWRQKNGSKLTTKPIVIMTKNMFQGQRQSHKEIYMTQRWRQIYGSRIKKNTWAKNKDKDLAQRSRQIKHGLRERTKTCPKEKDKTLIQRWRQIQYMLNGKDITRNELIPGT